MKGRSCFHRRKSASAIASQASLGWASAPHLAQKTWWHAPHSASTYLFSWVLRKPANQLLEAGDSSARLAGLSRAMPLQPGLGQWRSRSAEEGSGAAGPEEVSPGSRRTNLYFKRF